ncbi:MAG: aminoacyl-tRNA hydrolase [Gammaproteobacteria bacterium]|jgi:PTH1 family peptidyl-tRNA hydrolase
MSTPIRLIVGLGNPGPEYELTRHNAGAWFVEKIAAETTSTLNFNKKFHGLTCKTKINQHDCHLLIPTTFMNDSGQAVLALANFYKILPQEILVAHDDLDLPIGTVKLKQGGGHGGHNGLRDIISRLGSNDFARLRIGIGHPGSKERVTGHVLSKAKKAEKEKIDLAIDDTIAVLPKIISGNLAAAMQELHSS